MGMFLMMTTAMIRETPLLLPTTTQWDHWPVQPLVQSWPVVFQAMKTHWPLARSMHSTPWLQWRLGWTTMGKRVPLSSMSGAPSLSSQSRGRLIRRQLKRALRLDWPWLSSPRPGNFWWCDCISVVLFVAESNNTLKDDRLSISFCDVFGFHIFDGYGLIENNSNWCQAPIYSSKFCIRPQ